jgi:formamidopyrimidine-DNA glycosylase
MPELPEVETIKLQLDQTLKGRKITKIEVISRKNFSGQVDEVVGRKVEGVERRAKIILVKLSGEKCLTVHLKLTGQLIYRSADNKVLNYFEKENGPFSIKQLPNKFTTVIVFFDNGGILYFNDLRKFGWMKTVDCKEGMDNLPELKKFGPEAIDEKAFTPAYLQRILAKSRKPVKLVILDQEKLAGVGNIYANEALFMAGIMPTRPASSLTDKEVENLRESIIKVLRDSIAHKGTSDEDEAYRQISGEKGNFQNYLRVYRKDKEKCPRCGKVIEKIKVGGRGTFYCPACQR